MREVLVLSNDMAKLLAISLTKLIEVLKSSLLTEPDSSMIKPKSRSQAFGFDGVVGLDGAAVVVDGDVV